MKKFIRFVSFFLVLALFLFSVIMLIPDQFEGSYQRVLVTQYDYYRSIEENKIVFIGNSSLAYGLDLDLMEELTGRKCAIIGNHAGYGMTYLIEMSKSNLKSGDIVVIEFSSMSINSCGTELLHTGIGKRLDMYRFVYSGVADQMLEAYPSYLKKNLNYFLRGGYEPSGIYCAESFDERGNMIAPREGCVIPYPFDDEAAKIFTWKYFATEFESAFIDYLNEYTRYCEKLGVEVYYTIPYYLDESVKSSEETIEQHDEVLSAQLNAPLISKSSDYIFPREYIYNAIAHCNTVGAQHRTRLLYNDLKPYLE